MLRHLVRLLALALFPATVLAQSIPWTPSVPAALAAAKAEPRVIAFVFDLPGARGSEELVGEHLKHPTIAQLAARTVNVFCSTAAAARVPTVTPEQHQTALQAARLDVLKTGPGDDVLAPQVVFTDANGDVLSAVAHRTTTGELEWAWVDAIRRVDADFAWQYTPAARAPLRLELGSFARGQNRAPPTDEQVAAALKELRKSRGGWLANLQQVDVLLRSDDDAAVEYVTATLNGVPANFVGSTLDAIGLSSPRVYHSVLAGYLGHRDDDVRRAAAAALERLAEPKALAPALRRAKVERTDAVRGRLLRALAACGPTNKEVVAQLDKVLAKEDNAELRAHAVLALAVIEDRARVQHGLAAALRDPSPKVRATAAYALAWRRDAECADALAAAASREDDPDTKAWLDEAVKVVRGASGRAFDTFRERVLGEAPPRFGQRRPGQTGG